MRKCDLFTLCDGVHSCGNVTCLHCVMVFNQAWLCDIEKNMRLTLKESLKAAKNSLRRMLNKRDKWVKEYPGQVWTES